MPSPPSIPWVENTAYHQAGLEPKETGARHRAGAVGPYGVTAGVVDAGEIMDLPTALLAFAGVALWFWPRCAALAVLLRLDASAPHGASAGLTVVPRKADKPGAIRPTLPCREGGMDRS
jgi:hypothetical protein